jgi:hypothetical protein
MFTLNIVPGATYRELPFWAASVAVATRASGSYKSSCEGEDNQGKTHFVWQI